MSTDSKQSVLYNEVLSVTSDYLGPAAKRFIDRQIENHLNKEPGGLKPKDIDTLAEWSRLAFALLTEDKKIINEFIGRLKALSKGRS